MFFQPGSGTQWSLPLQANKITGSQKVLDVQIAISQGVRPLTSHRAPTNAYFALRHDALDEQQSAFDMRSIERKTLSPLTSRPGIGG